MKLIIFFILIINFDNLNAAEKWNFEKLQSNNSEHKTLVKTLLQSLNTLETTGAIFDTLSDISSNIGNLDNTARIQTLDNFYKSEIGQIKKGKSTLDSLKTQYLNELKNKCESFLKVIEPEKEKLPKKPKETINIQPDIKSPWDLSQVTITYKLEELKVLLYSFCTDSNGLSSDVTINDQIKNIEKLLIELNIMYNNSTECDNHKTNTDLQKYQSFKQKYIALQKELKRFSVHENSVLKNEPDSIEDEEYLSCEDNPSEDEDSASNKKSTINDCLPPKSKKLSALATIASIENSLTNDQLLTLKSNNQDQLKNESFLISLIEQLKHLDKVILILTKNCKEEELNTIKKELDALSKKISQSTELEKNTLDEIIHFEIVPNIKNNILSPLKKLCEQLSTNNLSNAEIKDRLPDINQVQQYKNASTIQEPIKKSLTIHSSPRKELNNLPLSAIITQTEKNLLTYLESWKIMQEESMPPDSRKEKKFSILKKLQKDLNILNQTIPINEKNTAKINTIQNNITLIMEKINTINAILLQEDETVVQPLSEESSTFLKDGNIDDNTINWINEQILIPLKQLCEQLPSIPVSIKNQSNQAINSKTITNKPESNIQVNSTLLNNQMTNDLSQDLSKTKLFSDLNNKKNQFNEKNPTPIPKNKDSKTNKRTWSKPKIIFGIALFSMTLYWFLKNYFFAKNSA